MLTLNFTEFLSMPSISLQSYLRFVRASAIYDLLATALFATPWSFALLRDQMSTTNQWLGGEALPLFGPFQVLIACLLGSIVLVWSVLRIVNPQLQLGRFDGAARFLFSTWMVWALVTTSAPLLWLFVVPEFAWGVAQWWPVRRPTPQA